MPGPPSATLIRATPSAASAAALTRTGLPPPYFMALEIRVARTSSIATRRRRKMRGNGRAGIARLRLEGGHHSTGDLADIDLLMFKMQLTGGQSRYVEKRRRALDEACYQPIDLLQHRKSAV